MLSDKRKEFDSFYHGFEQKCATLHLTDTGDVRQIKDKRKQTFYNILDDIIVQLKSRFENFCEQFFLGRVTISGKAKIGTMDGDFSRDQIYGLFKYFFNKSGTLKCSSGLECRGRGSAFKRLKKKGDFQKEKKTKKVITCLTA